MRASVLLLLVALTAEAKPPRPDGGVPTKVTGRVVDETGAGVADLTVTLTDTTQLSGYVDAMGCATYHPQFDTVTNAEGRFSATPPFRPNHVRVESRGWLRFPPEFEVDPSRPITITATTIPHHTWAGRVVDAEGKPVADVRVGPNNGRLTRTDADGRWVLELKDPAPDEFRIRRIGFKPLVVSSSSAETVVLKERRALLTITVLDPTKQPVTSPSVQVTALLGNERQSFCTAGAPDETHESAPGQCVLDSDPGVATLFIDGVEVQTVRVTGAPQALTVTVPPRPGNRY